MIDALMEFLPAALITFAVVPPLALAVRYFSKRLRDMSRASQKAIGGVAEVLR